MIQYLVFLGALVHLAGMLAYIRDTVRGTTKPNRVSWFLWALAPLIAASAAFADGARFAVVPIFMAGFGPLLVFCGSFLNKQAYWKLERFDYISGGLSIVALVLWLVTKDPVLAIVFALVSDAFATLPTITKSWKAPDTESGSAYAAVLFNAGISFIVIQSRTFTELVFPLYLIAQSVLMLWLIYRKPGHAVKGNL